MVTFLYFLVIFEYVYLFLSSSDDKIMVIIYISNLPLLIAFAIEAWNFPD